jgi:hypothetical protein
MTRTELATGSATFIAVAAAGWLSVASLDRHFAAAAVDNGTVSADRNAAQTTPCVGADGSWKNWVWSNVPMLSPKCAAEH